MPLEVPGYDGLEILFCLEWMELQLVELVEPVQQLLGHGDELRPVQLLFGIGKAAAPAPQPEAMLLFLLLMAQLLFQLLDLLLLLLHLKYEKLNTDTYRYLFSLPVLSYYHY